MSVCSSPNFTTGGALRDVLRTVLPAARPRRVAEMLPPGRDRKYEDFPKSKPLTHAMIADHIAGTRTYAATIDHNGLTRWGAIDVERDTPAEGRAALLRGLAALRDAGIVAFAIAVDNAAGRHYGGHILVPYSQLVRARDVFAQLHNIAITAELGNDGEPEVWPCNQVIRLPFGYHTRAKTRGLLITQDGELFNLDDSDELAAAIRYVATMPQNPPPPPAPAPVEQPKPTPRPVVVNATPGSNAGIIQRFNNEHPLGSLIEQYGAHKTRDGYSCPCGVQHTHETTLYISKRGKLFSYSPRCKFYTERGHDAFNLFTIVEHGGNQEAALLAIGYIPPTTPKQKRYDGVEPQHLGAEQVAARAADARRKRTSRRDEAAATLANVRQRLANDWQLSDRAAVVCMVLLDIAGDRDWCRPSIARLVDMTSYSESTVHRALRDLEQAGYIESDKNKGGAKGTTRLRTFVRVSHDSDVTPEYIYTCDHDIESDLTCEARAFPGDTPTPTTPAVQLDSSEPEPGQPPAADDARGSQALVADHATQTESTPTAAHEANGAGYNPADDWTLHSDAPPPQRRPMPRAKDVYTLSRPLGDLGIRALAEQVEMLPDEAPAPTAPPPVKMPRLPNSAQADKRRKERARYEAKLAVMTLDDLRGEVKKLRNTATKYNDPSWNGWKIPLAVAALAAMEALHAPAAPARPSQALVADQLVPAQMEFPGFVAAKRSVYRV
jgi:hypothetical protein